MCNLGICDYDDCDGDPSVTFDNGTKMCAYHGLVALLLGGGGKKGHLTHEDVGNALGWAWVEGTVPEPIAVSMRKLLLVPNPALADQKPSDDRSRGHGTADLAS